MTAPLILWFRRDLRLDDHPLLSAALASGRSLLPVFILLQEGMGTRPFGAVIVWYAAVILLFKMGRWLFEVENFIFVFLLSACLGAAYYAIAWLMAPLQNLPFDVQGTLDTSLIQAIFVPFAWRLLVATRHWNPNDQEN